MKLRTSKNRQNKHWAGLKVSRSFYFLTFQVPVLRGNIYQKGFWQTVGLFSIEWLPFILVEARFLSLSFLDFCFFAISNFRSPVQLFHLFYCHLGIVSLKTNASSCFGSALADMLSWRFKPNPHFSTKNTVEWFSLAITLYSITAIHGWLSRSVSELL